MRITLLALLAALAISWTPVTLDCRGGQEAQPVTYLVQFGVGTMGPRVGCPLDDAGVMVDCICWTFSEINVGEATTFEEPPDPPVGQVYMRGDPIAVDPAGNRSDGACEP